MPPQDRPALELRALTGIRGVAALYVVLYHFFQISAPPGVAGVVLLHGYLSVDLFFVLSGFVMALSYAASFTRDFTWPAYRDFLIKRLARIYPLFCAATLAAAVIAVVTPSPWLLVQNLLLIQSWGLGGSLDGPGWSISTEFAAYLLFPLLVALVLRPSWPQSQPWPWPLAAAVVSGVCLVCLAGLPSAVLNQIQPGGELGRNGPLDLWGSYTPWLVLRCLAGFTLGLVAFRLMRSEQVRRVAAHRLACPAIMLALLVLLATRRSDVVVVLLCGPLIMTLAQSRSLPAAVLAWGPVHWLGEISYSIYLVHILVNDRVQPPLKVALAAHGVSHAYTMASALQLGPVIVISALCFYGIERPARRAGRLLLTRRPPALLQPAPE